MLVTLLIASLTGSVFGGTMILLDRGSMKYALPLGAFLAAGALIATHVGQRLLTWYLGLY
jgi:prepilin signal peptidase PulO-like enzyme (type II secretory pathway)